MADQGISGSGVATEMLWLLGQPKLADYLDFVRHRAVGGERADLAALTRAWRAASDRFQALQTEDAGAAECSTDPLPDALAALADELANDPAFKRTFDTFPTRIVMVELDRLIVSQRHIVVGYAEGRADHLTAEADPIALFRYCLPGEQGQPPVRVRRLAENRYLFSSPSTDLRTHAPRLLPPDCAPDGIGPVAGIIGLIVGYGSNFLSAIRAGERMLLHNGYHRAWSLRAAGITHAPCVVQTVAGSEELRVAACDRVIGHPDHYLKAARPPLLKDYFDPVLTRRHRVLPWETTVEVEFKLRSGAAASRSG